MTTIHRLTLASIAEIEPKIKELEELINANPLMRMCEIEQEFAQLLKDYTGTQRLTVGFGRKLKYLKEEKDKANEIADKQKNIVALVKEVTTLRIELIDLKRELFYIEQKNDNKSN